jgi:hypothetical protein
MLSLLKHCVQEGDFVISAWLVTQDFSPVLREDLALPCPLGAWKTPICLPRSLSRNALPMAAAESIPLPCCLGHFPFHMGMLFSSSIYE